eukprot:scaffold264147_cov30-Tisochrysis_lutea.AAC.9
MPLSPGRAAPMTRGGGRSGRARDLRSPAPRSHAPRPRRAWASGVLTQCPRMRSSRSHLRCNSLLESADGGEGGQKGKGTRGVRAGEPGGVCGEEWWWEREEGAGREERGEKTRAASSGGWAGEGKARKRGRGVGAPLAALSPSLWPISKSISVSDLARPAAHTPDEPSANRAHSHREVGLKRTSTDKRTANGLCLTLTLLFVVSVLYIRIEYPGHSHAGPRSDRRLLLHRRSCTLLTGGIGRKNRRTGGRGVAAGPTRGRRCGSDRAEAREKKSPRIEDPWGS